MSALDTPPDTFPLRRPGESRDPSKREGRWLRRMPDGMSRFGIPYTRGFAPARTGVRTLRGRSMARGVDFMRLYHEFGLEPNATLDDLKLAYRRRVSALHPDRMVTDPISQHLAGEHLTRLTALYDAALRFHQQHGRLPGAIAPARGEAGDPPSTP
ncbi:MAG: J domain-containing protein, partial [Xanthomonadales bacterium]|nr:J domain-containing protein [Xanthomonadales bacterium]